MTVASQTHPVSLPASTISVPSSARVHTNSQLFSLPGLKIKATPHACVPVNLAPSNPTGKGLEEQLKVVVPLGGKVVVSWQVQTSLFQGLHLQGELSELQEAAEGAVESWIQDNLGLLGIDHADEVDDALNQLILYPEAALPIHVTRAQTLFSQAEPLAILKNIDLALSWTYPPGKPGKRSAADLDNVDGSNQVDLTLNDLFNDDPDEPDEIEQEGAGPLIPSIFNQVGEGMRRVLQLQLVRRFPFVFDAKFLRYQRKLELPRAISDATNQFLSLSAQHDTPLYSKCKKLLASIRRAQSSRLESRITTVARLPVDKRRPKRRKQAQRTQVEDDDDDAVARGAVYLQDLRIADNQATAEDKLDKALAHGIATLGTTRWLNERQGLGKMAPWRMKLNETSASYEPPQAVSTPTQNAILRQFTPAPDVGRSPTPPLFFDPPGPWPIEDDDYDDDLFEEENFGEMTILDKDDLFGDEEEDEAGTEDDLFDDVLPRVGGHGADNGFLFNKLFLPADGEVGPTHPALVPLEVQLVDDMGNW